MHSNNSAGAIKNLRAFTRKPGRARKSGGLFFSVQPPGDQCEREKARRGRTGPLFKVLSLIAVCASEHVPNCVQALVASRPAMAAKAKRASLLLKRSPGPGRGHKTGRQRYSFRSRHRLRRG